MDFQVALIILGFVIALMGPKYIHQKAMEYLTTAQKTKLTDLVGELKNSNLIVGAIIIIGFYGITALKQFDLLITLGAVLAILMIALGWLTYSLDKKVKEEGYPIKFRKLLMAAGAVKGIGLMTSIIFLSLWATSQQL